MCTRKILIPVFFITVTVLTRTLFHIGDNIEFLTATGLASSFFLNKKLGFLTIFVSLIISDFIIGNSSIFIFTWTGFLFSPLLSETIRRRKFSLLQSTSVIQGLGLLSTIIFFLWTNFGVVVTTNMYSKKLE